jgi:DNA primase
MKADRLLEEIKSRIDIVEFISDYVTLRKSGQNFKGLCPFHSEKTPSFMVSPAKQIFHCFGCGAGGDAVSFLMKQENLSFGEAVRYMAKKANIKVADYGAGRDGLGEKREKILRINEEAMKFFMKNLRDSAPATSYLEKRGIDGESMSRFCIGYASAERDTLFRHLKKEGFDDSLLSDTGLFVSDGRGHRDLFRGRIIFPIMSLKNDVIAFGGRVMDNSLPKYINSPETEIFKKSDTLFAINLAKEEIRKKGYTIIVEGYLDAIICHQYSFRNTVAPLGTALTPRQLQKLKLLCKRAVLVFDGDDAGIAAARRSLAILCESDFKAKVLLLPEGEDPDSFLRKNGSRPFQKMLSAAMSMIEFFLHTSRGEKTDSVREALSVISTVNDPIMADEMVRELADRSRISESVLRSELEKTKRRPVAQTSEVKRPSAQTINREEFLLLSALISSPEKAGQVLAELDIEEFRDDRIKSIFRRIVMLSGRITMDTLLAEADDAERALITELSLKPGFDPEHIDRNIEDCLKKLRQRRFEERRRLAEESGDIALLDSLLKEKRKLMKRIRL